MLYHIDTDERTAGGHTGTVYILSRRDIGARAEIWTAHGFNCLRWQVGGHDLLFSAEDWANNPLPTRSGVPILFPFPNRIRDGKYEHAGKQYQLPKNDSTHRNSIHGFSPRAPWSVFGYGVDEHSAWAHGDFRIRDNAPEAEDFWPGDAVLSIIYRLVGDRLRIECSVRNIGTVPFPFGLGFHPYFRLPGNDTNLSRYVLHAPARSIWPLVDSLPSGDHVPVPDDLNWNVQRQIGSAVLDTLYTDIGSIRHNEAGLLLRATLSHADRPGTIEVWTSQEFRETVLFTPVHRQAVCIEPYTCATDAINLTAQGLDAGWLSVAPGGSWSGIVEFRWDANA